MEVFTHLLITRFNLSSDKWIRDKNKHFVRTQEWMKRRMEIFTSYCFPSIANQKVESFKWLVYFHPDTDSKFLSSIKYLEKKYEFFEPRFCFKDREQFIIGISQDITSFIANNSEYLISTRLDNDDCLHPDALMIIQEKFDFQNYQVINFQLGFCLQIEPNNILTSRETEKGPFLSLIEKIRPDQKVKTVYSKKHDQFILEDQVYHIRDNPYWIQIIHNSNVGNTLKGKIVLNRGRIKEFNLKSVKISLIGTFEYIVKKYLQKFITLYNFLRHDKRDI